MVEYATAFLADSWLIERHAFPQNHGNSTFRGNRRMNGYHIKCKITFFILLTSICLHAIALLPIDQAFQLSATLNKNNKSIQATILIAPGYHLYKDHTHFSIAKDSQGQLGTFNYPAWKMFKDGSDIFKVYENSVTFNLPFSAPKDSKFSLLAQYQGCSNTVCYPPVNQYINIDLKNGSITVAEKANVTKSTTPTKKIHRKVNEQSRLVTLLSSQNFMTILLTFFGLGLLLTFTPCVLPMIPIISGLIIGQSVKSTKRAFSLSLAYVLTMAITYAGAGVLAALAGGHLQAALQSPWVISVFAAIFVLLALSLFGFYELRLPSFVETHVTKISNKQKGGSFIGVIIMGFLSTLIVSPCVSAPLVAALGYIAQTGNALLGGFALFSLGIGMGIPLLIIGTGSGKFMPKAGIWMNTVKYFFGVLLIATAIWLLERILPANITMFAWGILLIISSVCMGALEAKPQMNIMRFWRGVAICLLIWGILIIIGGCMGSTDPFNPIQATSIRMQNKTQSHGIQFEHVQTLAQLKEALAGAKAKHQPVMLDFYADWCIACQLLEKNVFSKAAAKQALKNYLILQADVTANNEDHKILQNTYDVVGPPTILFFNAKGDENKSARIVGEITLDDFLQHVDSLQPKK